MSKEILPINAQLVENLRIAKANAEIANTTLTEAQYALFAAVKDKLPQKGTTHFEGVKIVTGIYEKYDQLMLTEIQKTWIANIAFPFKTEWKPEAAAIKYVKENAPSAYELLATALTISEKKPSFEIVE